MYLLSYKYVFIFIILLTLTYSPVCWLRITGLSSPAAPSKVKLECMATYKLHDNVATMASVTLSPLRDSLLLGFRDAKLSIVEYDPYNHNLRTVSLHFFEKEDIKVCLSSLLYFKIFMFIIL